MRIDWDTASLVSAKPLGDAMLLTFDKPVMPDDMSMVLEGFSIADQSGKFYMAHAVQPLKKDVGIWNVPNKNCDTTEVLVWSPLVKSPVAVRYSWATSPMGNLKVNGKPWLPLASFRTDTWDWPEHDDPAESAVTRAQDRAMAAEAAERLETRRMEEAERAVEILKQRDQLHRRKTPNVVILYGDDVGYGDVGAYGSKKIPTPNLDRLAAEGLRFTDGHCSASTCTPSRYSLLTGEMPFRKQGTGIARGDANMIIAPEQFTLADVFQQSGYRTAVVGKWHLGLGDGQINWNQKIEPGPEALGFDQYFMIPATNDRTPCVYIANGRVVNLDQDDPITVSYGARIDDSVPGTAYPDGLLNPEAITVYQGDRGHSATVINGLGRIGYMKGGKNSLFKDEDMADDFVREAKAFITANRDRPFFLFFSASDIHAPRWPHQRFRGKSENGLRGDAMVSFDWSVGEILGLLKTLGLEENTLVIASSDNGPVYMDGGYQDGCEVSGSSGEDRGHDASGIYRGGKYQIYEGGTRVPFIVRWPGRVKPGLSDALMSQVDLLASCAAMLDVKIPNGQARDSRNYLKALLGEEAQGAEIIMEHSLGQVAIRRNHWKYIGKNPQLYDLSRDPGETENLVGRVPAVAKEMKELLDTCTEQPLGSR
jgi:arylsulfatase A-like enzyme